MPDRLPFFLIPLLAHLPIYAVGILGAKLVEDEMETQAQMKVAFGLILSLITYPCYSSSCGRCSGKSRQASFSPRPRYGRSGGTTLPLSTQTTRVSRFGLRMVQADRSG